MIAPLFSNPLPFFSGVGEFVARDEPIAIIETDKVDVTINSPESGIILELFAKEGETVSVGGNLFKLELGDRPKGQTNEKTGKYSST